MFLKLDQEVISLLCCPLCKGALFRCQRGFVCKSCALEYAEKSISVGDHQESVYDFRIHRPSYCVPATTKRWEKIQERYEKDSKINAVSDDLNPYQFEIEGVKEIYTDEFNITGRVLDVGGCEGRLRHFLIEEQVPLYVSVDPYLDSFENIQKQANLLKAYPSLSKPCNFIPCHAEYLPFKSNSFDWVHMRSVVDHFADPYLAFKEAYRVLVKNGNLMIGLAIVERIKNNDIGNLLFRLTRGIKQKGIGYLLKVASKRILGVFRKDEGDDHMFRLTYNELVNLLASTGFKIEKETWQKPPCTFCIYLSATKHHPSY